MRAERDRFVGFVLDAASDRLVVNDDIVDWHDLPEPVAVVGIGVIGLELGQALHRLRPGWPTRHSPHRLATGHVDDRARTAGSQCDTVSPCFPVPTLMCGRFNITCDPAALLDLLEILERYRNLDAFKPRYNIAPGEPPLSVDSTRQRERRVTTVPIVRQEADHLSATMATWPLIPVWARGEVPRYSTANARCETLHEKHSFRHAWHHGQRCLILASGFYEWQDAGGERKQPWCIRPGNDNFFTFGGLWEISADVLSCTIVTMPANPLMRTIHNAGNNRHRMPLILTEDTRTRWLTGSHDDAASVITPFPADEMAAHPISTKVNNPYADSADILEPVQV